MINNNNCTISPYYDERFSSPDRGSTVPLAPHDPNLIGLFLSGSAEGAGVEEGRGCTRHVICGQRGHRASVKFQRQIPASNSTLGTLACVAGRAWPDELLAGARASGPGCCVAAWRLSTADRAACYLRAQHCGEVRKYQIGHTGVCWRFFGALQRCVVHAPRVQFGQRAQGVGEEVHETLRNLQFTE